MSHSDQPERSAALQRLDVFVGQWEIELAVARLYQMSLRDGVWRQWRDDPAFAQHFSATISDDGRTITGAWEIAEDGVTWNHNFDLTYTKLSD